MSTLKSALKSALKGKYRSMGRDIKDMRAIAKHI